MTTDNNDYSKSVELNADGAPNSRHIVTIPEFVSNKAGNFIIYTRLSASRLLDRLLNEEITASRIFELNSLAAQTGNKTLREFIREKMGSNTPNRFFKLDTIEELAKISNGCDSLKLTLREKMKLTNMDRLVIRWAVLRDSGLYGLMKNPKKIEKIAWANGKKQNEIEELCWSKQDEIFLKSISKHMNLAFK